MSRFTILACLFLCLGALAAPFTILVNGGKQELVPLSAMAGLLGGTVNKAMYARCSFSARGKTLDLARFDVGFAEKLTAEELSTISADTGTDRYVDGVAVIYDGELYADKTVFMNAFGLKSATDFNHTLTDPQSGNKLALPVGAVMPDLFGPSLASGIAISIDGEPYVQITGLAAALAGGVNLEAGTGRMLVTVNGHFAAFAPYSTAAEGDYQPQILTKQSVVYEDKLYVPAVDFARLFELTLEQPSKEERARLFFDPGKDSDAMQVETISHPTLKVPVYLTTLLQYQIRSVSADFDGDKTVEIAYARCLQPAYVAPVSVWIQKGAKNVWKLGLPDDVSNSIVRFHARDLTGDGVPELVFGCWFTGAYTGSIGLTAYRWDPERKIFSNVLGSGTEDGFLTYTGNGGDGGIVFQPGANGKPPTLIRYQTVEWRELHQHYKATWFTWNGKFFVYKASKTTKKAYDTFSETFKIQQVFNELGITGVSLLRAMEDE